jgi:hypothetical protein
MASTMAPPGFLILDLIAKRESSGIFTTFKYYNGGIDGNNAIIHVISLCGQARTEYDFRCPLHDKHFSLTPDCSNCGAIFTFTYTIESIFSLESAIER